MNPQPRSMSPQRNLAEWLRHVRLGVDVQALRRRFVSSCMKALSRPAPSALTQSEHIPARGIYRVLICRPNHRLGNQLLLTPLIAELQTRYPGAQVDLVVGGDQGPPLFSRFPNVGTVYRLPRHAFRHPFRTLGVLRKLRRERYDLAIDPDQSSQSSRYLLGRCRSTWRLGFSGEKSREGLSLAMPAPVALRHMGKQPVGLLRWAIGAEAGPSNAELPTLDIRLSDDERAWGRRGLAELLRIDAAAAGIATIAIFAHATRGKRYAPEWWAQILDGLRERYPGCEIIEILPAHGESSVVSGIPGYYSSDPRRMAAIISATQLFVTADCGVMHLACAARGPVVVGLFQCTDPERYAPYGGANIAVSTVELSPSAVCERIRRAYPG
jgi:heptosyltransferase III